MSALPLEAPIGGFSGAAPWRENEDFGEFRWASSFSLSRVGGSFGCILGRLKCGRAGEFIINKEMNAKIVLMLLVCLWLSHAQSNTIGTGDVIITGVNNTGKSGDVTNATQVIVTPGTGSFCVLSCSPAGNCPFGMQCDWFIWKCC